MSASYSNAEVIDIPLNRYKGNWTFACCIFLKLITSTCCVSGIHGNNKPIFVETFHAYTKSRFSYDVIIIHFIMKIKLKLVENFRRRRAYNLNRITSKSALCICHHENKSV